jgi:hypothetical protein
MRRTVSILVAVALVLTLAASTAQAGKTMKKAPSGAVVGTITAVSEDGKSITVATLGAKKKKKQGAAGTELKLGSRAQIVYVGFKDKGEQKLAVGQVVLVALDESDPTQVATVAVGKAAPGKTKKKKNQNQ